MKLLDHYFVSYSTFSEETFAIVKKIDKKISRVNKICFFLKGKNWYKQKLG